MKRSILLALSCVSIGACRSEGSAEQSAALVAELLYRPASGQVLSKAYDNSYQTPAQFYVDERAATLGSYSVYHVKDVSVSYEICSDDFNEALALEAADNASRSVNGDLVTTIENSRYFEFVRELSYPDSIGNIADPTSQGFSRIFKCSYINRDGADRNLRNGFAGKLNASPLAENVVKTYSEYMWQFTFFWPARPKVLNSYSAETEDGFQNTLQLILVTNQGVSSCDLIEVIDWEFSANKTTGQVTKRFRKLYEIEAQLVDGSPQECAG